MKGKLHVPRILLLIETSRVYGRQLIEGIGRYARENGPWLFSFEEQGLDELSLRTLNLQHIDGVISRIRDPAMARRLQATGLPFVEMYGNPITCKTHVTVDEEALVRMAADHLLGLGLKHLGFFARQDQWWIVLRRRAFITCLASLGHTCHVYSDPDTTLHTPLNQLRLQAEIVKWLKALPKPAGILCANDLEALTLLETCRQMGLVVPDQIAVLGIDNDSVICSVAWPCLSSIDLDAQRIGYESAAFLARMMANGRKRNVTIRVAPKEVLVRESTDVLAIADSQIAKAVRLIRQFACKGLAVEHVSDHVGMCRRTLERRFKACMGCTLNEELLRVKMEQAQRLLSQSNYPMKRISNLSGFGSLPCFTRAFRRETGETPGHYRRRTR